MINSRNFYEHINRKRIRNLLTFFMIAPMVVTPMLTGQTMGSKLLILGLDYVWMFSFLFIQINMIHTILDGFLPEKYAILAIIVPMLRLFVDMIENGLTLYMIIGGYKTTYLDGLISLLGQVKFTIMIATIAAMIITAIIKAVYKKGQTRRLMNEQL